MQAAGFPGEAWQELLEEGPGGWRPRFDVEGAIDSTVDMGERHCWDEWRAIRCPTLVVGGAQSPLSQAELRSMASRLPCGRYAVVEGAGHNVHLDRPDEWRTVVEGFLREQKLGVRRPAGP
jgi:pimeloyl-ACP methyl ester carboxylesterase